MKSLKSSLIRLLWTGPLVWRLLWDCPYDWKWIHLIWSVLFCFMFTSNKRSSVSGSMLLYRIANTVSQRFPATDIIVRHHTHHVGNYLASCGLSYIEFSFPPGLRILYISFKGFYFRSIDTVKYCKAWSNFSLLLHVPLTWVLQGIFKEH